MAAKKEWEFKSKKVKGVSICSGCIESFPDKELSLVHMPAGYTTPFCGPCIKKEGITEDRIKEPAKA